MRSLWFLTLGACIVPPPYASDVDTDDSDVADDTDTPVGPTPSGITVVVLDDGGSADEVVPALEAAGHEIKGVRDYTEWDGTNPNLTDVDVVVFLQGREYEDGLGPGGDTALVVFVTDGGGLIRTERAAFATTLPPALNLDAGLPVQYLSGPLEDTQWRVIDRDSPLVDGLPTQWDEPGGYSKVTAKVGATVVIDKQGGDPLVTWDDSFGGRIIHVNHDMTATSSTLSSAMQTLMANAVTFAAQ